MQKKLLVVALGTLFAMPVLAEDAPAAAAPAAAAPDASGITVTGYVDVGYTSLNSTGQFAGGGPHHEFSIRPILWPEKILAV